MFPLNSGPKKRSSSQIMPRGCGLSAFFRAQLSHVYSVAGRDGILSCGSRFLPTNSGVKTKKKGSSARNLRLRLGVHSCFSSWNGTTHAWGAQAVFWGAQTRKYAQVPLDLLFSFEAQSSLGGHKQ